MSICSICMDVIDEKDLNNKKIECGHVFHDNCLQAWIDCGNNEYHSGVATCPLCRYWFYTTDDLKNPSLLGIIFGNIIRVLQLN